MRESINFDKKEQLGAKEQSIGQVRMESEEDHRRRQIEGKTLVGGEKFIVKTRLSATEIIQQMPNTINQFSSINKFIVEPSEIKFTGFPYPSQYICYIFLLFTLEWEVMV